MILTVDNGQSSTKIANVQQNAFGTIPAEYPLEDIVTKEVPERDLNNLIIEEARRRGRPTTIAIATTWFISESGKVAGDPRQRASYLDTQRIQEETGASAVSLYNDAEAAAFAVNVLHNQVQIQSGSPHTIAPRVKTLVYLGTGFQLVRCHRDPEGEYIPSYGGGLRSSVPVSLLDIIPEDVLERLEEAATETTGGLRHSHLLGACGLQNIHQALTEAKREVKDILADPNPKVFALYSSILGSCLRNFASTEGFSQHLIVGGSFAPLVLPYVDRKLLREAFAVPDHVGVAFDHIPIYFMNEPSAANKGVAYAVRHNIPTSANVYKV